MGSGTTTRADLLAADPAEISDHLLEAGLTGVKTELLADGSLQIEADQTGAAITAALTDWVATTTFDRATGATDYGGSFPAVLEAHRIHLRDFRDAVRAGSPLTLAQTQHALADVIDALRLVARRYES